MGNSISSDSHRDGGSSNDSHSNNNNNNNGKNKRRGNDAAERMKRMVGDVQEEIKRSVKKLDEDHPAAQFFDSVCGVGFVDDERSVASSRYYRRRNYSAYSEDDYTEDGSRTVSEDETTAYDDQSRRSRADQTVESQSYMSESQYDSDHRKGKGRSSSSGRRHGHGHGDGGGSFDTEDEQTEASSAMAPSSSNNPATSKKQQPLASSFAKRCYFTKSGIGRSTQHYEGLTLTGNVVLMLAAAMKLKGCPTICDEDLRRVEQTYPNQFSRLPDELLLSSGWRRISKYCHFSNKPIPDGVPFFHSKQRLHPSGGYYFLLAAAVGMTRPIDIEPLTKDTLVLLETDYPTQCDAAPSILVRDPEQWTPVDKFCFFSGGPINTEEDVYYQADFDGNPIFMLAFLSPSLTPDELYKLGEEGEPALQTIAAVQEVESVYDLTERDFDDLRLYHLGPCRALPEYNLTPRAWTKILPPHFVSARQRAFARAEDFMQRHGIPMDETNGYQYQNFGTDPEHPTSTAGTVEHFQGPNDPMTPGFNAEFQRQVEEEGAFYGDQIPDEGLQAIGHFGRPNDSAQGPTDPAFDERIVYDDPVTPKMDPPEDEPPSLQKSPIESQHNHIVPDPDDPSVMASPNDASATGDPNRAFFSDNAIASSSQQQQQQQQQLLGELTHPASPEDEHSADLINLDSVEDQGAPEYDPFSNHLKISEQASQQGDFLDEQGSPNFRYDNQSNAFGGNDGMPNSGYDDWEEKKKGANDYSFHTAQYLNEDSLKSGEEDFIPIKRDGFQLGGGPHLVPSPSGSESVTSHKSAAFRSAQELLRKNRRKRLEEQSVADQSRDRGDYDPTDLPNQGTWESASDVSGSMVSGSSVWSDASGTDRNSRRALILQMAKARMRNNKESPTKSTTMSPSHGVIMEEETESLGGHSGPNTEIDIAGDLD